MKRLGTAGFSSRSLHLVSPARPLRQVQRSQVAALAADYDSLQGTWTGYTCGALPRVVLRSVYPRFVALKQLPVLHSGITVFKPGSAEPVELTSLWKVCCGLLLLGGIEGEVIARCEGHMCRT
jgi:hypothetical protein